MGPLIRTNSLDPDRTAQQLIQLAACARGMPPSWKGAHISHPVMLPSGGHIGKVLPGVGLSVDADLKDLGILKPIPGVFERTPVCRILEALQESDGAISTYDGIINARCNSKADDVVFFKNNITTVANVWFSIFQSTGFPTTGTYTNISGGAVQTRANVGALSLGLSNPSNPDKKYLLTFGFTSAQIINFAILLDMLVGCGNINANSNATQTVNSVALTRYTTGAGVLPSLVVTTAIGGTPSNFTISAYHNQANTAGQATAAQAMTTSAIVQRIQPVVTGPFMNLASGDYGVRSVESVIFSAAMGAGGVVALDLSYPLAFLPGIAANIFVERDSTIQIDGITELMQDGSQVIGCLNMYINTNTTTSGNLGGYIRTCSG